MRRRFSETTQEAHPMVDGVDLSLTASPLTPDPLSPLGRGEPRIALGLNSAPVLLPDFRDRNELAISRVNAAGCACLQPAVPLASSRSSSKMQKLQTNHWLRQRWLKAISESASICNAASQGERFHFEALVFASAVVRETQSFV